MNNAQRCEQHGNSHVRYIYVPRGSRAKAAAIRLTASQQQRQPNQKEGAEEEQNGDRCK
jgi:hypothetical protein